MNVHRTELERVLIIEPKVFNDQRGYFFETYSQSRYQEIGIKSNLVQDNLSFSKKGTLRGLHYQHPHYKCSDFYAPECEGGILWSDPDVAIDWPLDSPIVSEKDAQFSLLKDVVEDRLPSYK